MVDGLKLTMTGDELHRLLAARIREHEECAARWRHERERTHEDQTDEDPLLPEHMCENEEERHQWRAEVLTFIREHIEPGEVYRLGETDLLFAELLPEKPGWLEQSEYEERTNVGFQLERLVKQVRITPSASLLGHAAPTRRRTSR